MSQGRKNIVINAFKYLDKNREGAIDSGDLKDMYAASQHPDVLTRKKTEEEALAEFLDTFEEFYYYQVYYLCNRIEPFSERWQSHSSRIFGLLQ